MIVVAPAVGWRLFLALENVACDPFPRVRIKIFVDPRDHCSVRSLDVLGTHISRKQREVLFIADDVLRWPVQEVRQSDEGLGGCKGPGGAIPKELVIEGIAGGGASSFSSRGGVRSLEAFGIVKLFPRYGPVRGRQVEVPRHVAHEL